MSSTLPPSEKLIGQTLQGRYRILEFVAEGGMGAVYRGERLGLERSVAIKFPRPILAADTDGRRRFEREAKAMSRLDHPNCVSVTDFGMAPDPYIVMEFVTGETVREVIDRGRVDLDRSLYICQQILAGLAHAHDRQIVHRDIKPPNIMITEAEGTEGLVRILDFGLAKLHTKSKNTDESSPFLVVGTPSYMSPEQAGATKTDSRSDLYSVGIILFEAVTGVKPYDAAEIRETLRMHREASIPRISKVAPEVNAPFGLQQIIDRALAKRPEDRYQTAAEFSDAITALRETLKAKRASGKSRAAAAFAATQETPCLEFPPEELEKTSSVTSGEPASPARPLAQAKKRAPWGLVLLLLLSGSVAFAYYDPLRVVPDWTGLRPRPQARAPLPETNHDSVQPHAAQAISSANAAVEPANDASVPLSRPLEQGTADGGIADAGLALELDASWEDELDEDGLDQDELDEDGLEEDGLEEDGLSEDELEEDEAAELVQVDTEKAIIIEDSSADSLGASPPPLPIRNVADAKARAAEGKRSEAIVGLRKLRAEQPKAPNVRLLLGDLYFEQRWWSDGLAEYAAAIDLKPSLRKRALISQNAILALGSQKTRKKARAFLINKVGRSGLAQLRRAASRGKSQTIRKHAAALVTRISVSKSQSRKKSRR